MKIDPLVLAHRDFRSVRCKDGDIPILVEKVKAPKLTWIQDPIQSVSLNKGAHDEEDPLSGQEEFLKSS